MQRREGRRTVPRHCPLCICDENEENDENQGRREGREEGREMMRRREGREMMMIMKGER